MAAGWWLLIAAPRIAPKTLSSPTNQDGVERQAGWIMTPSPPAPAGELAGDGGVRDDLAFAACLERAPAMEATRDVTGRHSGYSTASQALEAGFSRASQSYHHKAGNGLRVGWGIYLLSHFPHWRARTSCV
jgi:hypothetical protein